MTLLLIICKSMYGLCALIFFYVGSRCPKFSLFQSTASHTASVEDYQISATSRGTFVSKFEIDAQSKTSESCVHEKLRRFGLDAIPNISKSPAQIYFKIELGAKYVNPRLMPCNFSRPTERRKMSGTECSSTRTTPYIDLMSTRS